MKAILGKKLKMSQVFDKSGKPIPVTIIEVGPNYITAIKTKERDGYNSIQIGYGKDKKIKKPQEGIIKKLKINDKLKFYKEFKTENTENISLGDKINVSIFNEGEKVKVSGISKGKGFQGVIKRWGFHRGPETHGSDHHRHTGSIGSMFPQRVVKGRKMPGNMGRDKTTIYGLKIIKVIPETNIIMLKGAVPGPNKALVSIEVQ